MISKSIILPLIIVVILSGIGGILTAKKVTEDKLTKTQLVNTEISDESSSSTKPETNTVIDEKSAVTMPGRYAEYSAEKAGEGYENTILFFYASWCPECRGFKQNLVNANIPKNTQILEVNYDKSEELKKQYSVTLQSTFVNIDSKETQKTKWVGYGKDKDLETVLENLKVK